MKQFSLHHHHRFHHQSHLVIFPLVMVHHLAILRSHHICQVECRQECPGVYHLFRHVDRLRNRLLADWIHDILQKEKLSIILVLNYFILIC